MRIRCPSCSTTYEVADALLDPPRTVRCARCAHDWMATPVVETPPPLPPTEPDPPPPSPELPEHTADETVVMVQERVISRPLPEPAAEPEPELPDPMLGETPLSAIERLAGPFDPYQDTRRRGRWLTVAWAASFAILAGLGVAGYTERDLLMRQWPASKRVYAMLGLAHIDARSGDAKGTDTPPPR